VPKKPRPAPLSILSKIKSVRVSRPRTEIWAFNSIQDQEELHNFLLHILNVHSFNSIQDQVERFRLRKNWGYSLSILSKIKILVLQQRNMYLLPFFQFYPRSSSSL